MSELTAPKIVSQIGSKRAWFIWCLSALTFGYAFFHRVAPSVMVSDLMAEFTIGAALLGTLASLYFYPYVAMQFVLGALIDRFGPRLLLTAALLTGAAGSFLFGSADNLTLAYIGRLLVGAGSAVGFLATLAIAGKWFPPERFAFLAGLTMFFGMISGIFSSGPLAIFVEGFGWRNAMWSMGGFSILLAMLIFVFVRNAPEALEDEVIPPRESWGDMWRGLGRAASTLEVWKVAIVAFSMSGPMLALGTLWSTPYTFRAYDLTRPEAAFYASFMLFGWALGAPFFGWLSDRLRKRKIILVANSGFLSLALFVLVFLPTPPLWFTASLYVAIGLAGSAMSVTFALGREGSAKEISGSVLGIVNAMTVGAGAFLQPFVGYLLDVLWDGTMVDDSPVYSAQNYQYAFICILVVVALGFLVSLTLRESPIADK